MLSGTGHRATAKLQPLCIIHIHRQVRHAQLKPHAFRCAAGHPDVHSCQRQLHKP